MGIGPVMAELMYQLFLARSEAFVPGYLQAPRGFEVVEASLMYR